MSRSQVLVVYERQCVRALPTSPFGPAYINYKGLKPGHPAKLPNYYSLQLKLASDDPPWLSDSQTLDLSGIRKGVIPHHEIISSKN